MSKPKNHGAIIFWDGKGHRWIQAGQIEGASKRFDGDRSLDEAIRDAHGAEHDVVEVRRTPGNIKVTWPT